MPITLLLAGALLCNAVPHLTAGLRGEVFPTPFAKPRGKGPSSPLVNVLWGAFKLGWGLVLLGWHPVEVGPNLDCAMVAIGALAIGCYLAIHFGRVRRDARWGRAPAGVSLPAGDGPAPR